MLSVRNRVLAALLVAAPAAGILVGSPAQAVTTSTITVKSVSVSPSSLTLGTAKCASVAFSATLSDVLPTDGYAYTGVGVDVYAPGAGDDDDTVASVEFAQVGSTATYKGTTKICGKSGAGKFEALVYGVLVPTTATTDDDFEMTNIVTKTITVKRPSTLSLNASPEPVKKGKKLTAKGTLKIDGKVLSGASVKIYFQASGSKTWTLKGTATTSSKGVYTKKFTATKTGTWKAVYAGTATKVSASATDAVKVTK
ncbi:hypothetical protein [Actinoplanes sp. NPDC051851]|uniref:hypothetical protein n=1 Tax=Actinoplanes sp. NPDC051851 TaxID=3154753 RepID=UPI003430341E